MILNKFIQRLRKNTSEGTNDEVRAEAFVSSRLQEWRTHQSELRASFIETLDVISRVGWQTWSVASNEKDEANFSYTVGLYDNFGFPELISVGLEAQVGGPALNSAIRLMREGLQLTHGRISNVLGGDIQVEFEPVDSKWLHRVMLRTKWYYKGADVPVLQLVFPDLENRFPWEDGFNKFFQHPMLAPGYPEQDLEREFWDSHDFNFDQAAWKFTDPPSTRVRTTESIELKSEPITYVARDPDDASWMFLGPHMIKGLPVVSRLRRIVANDPSIEELADLKPGGIAIRDYPNEPWERLSEGDADD